MDDRAPEGEGDAKARAGARTARHGDLRRRRGRLCRARGAVQPVLGRHPPVGGAPACDDPRRPPAVEGHARPAAGHARARIRRSGVRRARPVSHRARRRHRRVPLGASEHDRERRARQPAIHAGADPRPAGSSGGSGLARCRHQPGERLAPRRRDRRDPASQPVGGRAAGLAVADMAVPRRDASPERAAHRRLSAPGSARQRAARPGRAPGSAGDRRARARAHERR